MLTKQNSYAQFILRTDIVYKTNAENQFSAQLPIETKTALKFGQSFHTPIKYWAISSKQFEWVFSCFQHYKL